MLWQTKQPTAPYPTSERSSTVLLLQLTSRMNNNPQGRYASLKDSTIPALVTPHSQKVSAFHKSLCQATGDKLKELQVKRPLARAQLQNANLSFQTTSLSVKDFNYVQFLQEIALEQQFEATYVDIEEKSLHGHSQCLLQLSTLPVAVCYGCGPTSKDAQSRAAQNALEYLKLMTKKWESMRNASRFFGVAFSRLILSSESISWGDSVSFWFFLSKTSHFFLFCDAGNRVLCCFFFLSLLGRNARCRQGSLFTSYTLHRISGFFLNLLRSQTLICQVKKAYLVCFFDDYYVIINVYGKVAMLVVSFNGLWW